MSALLRLVEHGQSYWMDNLTREMLASGSLAQRVRETGLRGITANPTTFQNAVTGSHAYDQQVRERARAGMDARSIYQELAVTDVRNACDVLRPVYAHTSGEDGYVSLEVSPHLARDAMASIEEARRLVRAVDRPNVLIKIPGTKEGLRAIEALLAEGININVTLLFAVGRYEEVADAYMRALERRLKAHQPIASIASVASFFLSRIDVLVDELLGHRVRPDGGSSFEPHPDSLRGKAALASAKLAYRSFQRMMSSARWSALARQGARPQRLLWASTSTKNPEYSDVMYVEGLIAPQTVNTMPEKTIAAFANHGKVADTLTKGITEATHVMRDLRRVGIDMKQVTEQLENEGIEKFCRSYDTLMTVLEQQRGRYASADELAPLALIARKLRREVIRMTTTAGSGHPTSCMSAAEIMAALFFRVMRWDPSDPHARDVDQFVLSKGHAAPILWAALSEAGAIDEDPMTLRRIDSTLEGHPTPRNPWVHVATGSLGQGLAAANGIALANRLDGIDARVFCLLGDGECSEGSVWEAAQFASLNRLAGVIAIVDENGFGQSAAAPYDHNTSVLADRFRAFGWNATEIDGHDLAEVTFALERAGGDGKPTAVVARTVKGKGVSFVENRDGWHGRALDAEQMKQALDELGEADISMSVPARRLGASPDHPGPAPALGIDYQVGGEVATRDGFGEALRQLGERHDIVVVDGDVKNSTRSAGFANSYPERFFEGYIAEQNMVGIAMGLASCGKVPFVATFACFLTRAADFIRMAGHSQPRHLVFCGSHAGVSIGEDGPSQMGLEDIAMFRALADSTVLYPCDAVSAMRLTEAAAATDGIVYLRTSRPKTPVIYDAAERFPVGGSKTLRSSPHDRATIVAAGITVHEALAAHALLDAKGVKTRVIDAYSVKPIDARTLRRAAEETGGIVVVEDHWVDGGLGDAVAATVVGTAKVVRLGVSQEPHSGSKDELLERAGISRRTIVDAVTQISGARRAA